MPQASPIQLRVGWPAPYLDLIPSSAWPASRHKRWMETCKKVLDFRCLFYGLLRAYQNWLQIIKSRWYDGIDIDVKKTLSTSSYAHRTPNIRERIMYFTLTGELAFDELCARQQPTNDYVQNSNGPCALMLSCTQTHKRNRKKIEIEWEEHQASTSNGLPFGLIRRPKLIYAFMIL